MYIEGIPKERVRSIELRKVIWVVTVVGEGTEENPVREVHRALVPETASVLFAVDTMTKKAPDTKQGPEENDQQPIIPEGAHACCSRCSLQGSLQYSEKHLATCDRDHRHWLLI